MAIPITRRLADRNYLGDIKEMRVHDLRAEVPNCQIDQIIHARHAVVLSPDSLSEAKREGFDPCGRCIGGSWR
jgi:hypothetical protein